MCEGLGSAAPIFRVADLRASIDYYVDVLGFEVDWEDPGSIASVSRDRCCIFLCEGDQGNPGAWTWIGVGDVEALFEEYRTKGAKVRNPPANFSWALEMQIEDLDGNVLRLGSEPREGQPFGPWRDMHGDLWVMQPEGGWARVDLRLPSR
jgi:catechol 2,3-dioxygenase-like lactoylglutathione lyase family enzyme